MMNKRLKSFPGFIAVWIFLFAWGVMAQERFGMWKRLMIVKMSFRDMDAMML